MTYILIWWIENPIWMRDRAIKDPHWSVRTDIFYHFLTIWGFYCRCFLCFFFFFYRPNNCVHSLKRKREGYEHPSELHVSTSPSQHLSSHHPLDGDKELHEPFRKSVRKQGMGGRFRHWWRAVFSKRIFSIVFFVMVAEIRYGIFVNFKCKQYWNSANFFSIDCLEKRVT